MIAELGLLLRGGFGLVVALVLPLVAVAAVTGALVGLLTGALGIRDQALGQILRALAVLAALALSIEAMADAAVDFADRSWSELGAQTSQRAPR